MTMFPHWTLQTAIYGVLSADATLTALITGIYDFVPQDAAYPYIVLGDAQGADTSNLHATGMRFDVMIAAYSQEAGRKEAAAILDRIYTLLNGAELTVTDHILVYLRVTGSSITLNKDGVTYTGAMRLRAGVMKD